MVLSGKSYDLPSVRFDFYKELGSKGFQEIFEDVLKAASQIYTRIYDAALGFKSSRNDALNFAGVFANLVSAEQLSNSNRNFLESSNLFLKDHNNLVDLIEGYKTVFPSRDEISNHHISVLKRSERVLFYQRIGGDSFIDKLDDFLSSEEKFYSLVSSKINELSPDFSVVREVQEFIGKVSGSELLERVEKRFVKNSNLFFNKYQNRFLKNVRRYKNSLSIKKTFTRLLNERSNSIKNLEL